MRITASEDWPEVDWVGFGNALANRRWWGGPFAYSRHCVSISGAQPKASEAVYLLYGANAHSGTAGFIERAKPPAREPWSGP